MKQPDCTEKDKRWSVYIILASDNRLYTGITTDIIRRWKQHSGASGGARFSEGESQRNWCTWNRVIIAHPQAVVRLK